MVQSFFNAIRLMFGLWWAFVIVFGSVVALDSLYEKKWTAFFISFGLVLLTTIYLALAPLTWLQLTPPDPLPSVVTYPEDGGLPQAETLQWDLMPGIYETTNELFIPFLKSFWYAWVPGWFLVLLVNSQKRMINLLAPKKPKTTRKSRR
jgi:hypothetical protein